MNEKLQQKNIRPTAMRQLVLKVMLTEKRAMSLSDLEEQFDNADKSTLFRTLRTFEDKRLIHSIDDGTGSLKYAICHDSCEVDHNDFHVHFFCLKCEQTYCLNDVMISSVNLPHGFKMEVINTIVKGVCVNCEK